MDEDLKKIMALKFPELVSNADKYSEKIINDIPVLIGARGEIICIPNRFEIPSPIGCVAKKGKGKSLIMHRIAEEAFHNLGWNVAIMNDIGEEVYDWCKKQNVDDWITQLYNIGEVPVGMPIVYLYPHTATLKLKEIKQHNQPYPDIAGRDINYLKITVPFDDFITNLDKYMNLDKSAKYLRNLKDELLACESTQDVYDVINEGITGKYAGQIVGKIIAEFDNVFDEQILQITNRDAPSILSAGGYTGNPFVVLMKIGVIPCLITSDLYQKRYMPQVLAYHINSIFNAQSDVFEGKKTYLVFDELTRICSSESENIVTEALNQIAARGRMKNIGIIYATQNYEKIPRIIRTNTEYLFALRHSNKEEVDEIAKDFDLPNFDSEELLKLDKLECIAITSEFFKVYHRDGSVTEEAGPLKGKIIPPMSRHKAPSKSINQEVKDE